MDILREVAATYRSLGSYQWRAVLTQPGRSIQITGAYRRPGCNRIETSDGTFVTDIKRLSEYRRFNGGQFCHSNPIMSGYLALFLHEDIAAGITRATFLGHRDLTVDRKVFQCLVVESQYAPKLTVTYWIDEKTKLVLRGIQSDSSGNQTRTPDHITTITWFRINPTCPIASSF